jgi:hypothetical protein
VQGELVQGELVQGELVQGELVQGELVQGELVQGELVQGELGVPRFFGDARGFRATESPGKSPTKVCHGHAA